MYKFNNQDDYVLNALAAVYKIISREKSKDNFWKINTLEEYHEEK